MALLIRELTRDCTAEIDWVASRMQHTLVEVLGAERGSSMYSLEWLRERVLWHLDRSQRSGVVFVAQDGDGTAVGHAIARVEPDHGFFSTLYVEPKHREKGVATHMARVESWLREQGMQTVVYFTAKTNARLIRLFGKRGYELSDAPPEMVRLSKTLSSAEPPTPTSSASRPTRGD